MVTSKLLAEALRLYKHTFRFLASRCPTAKAASVAVFKAWLHWGVNAPR